MPTPKKSAAAKKAPAANKSSSSKKPSSPKPGTIAANGAKSPNRPEATSSKPQTPPIKAPRKAVAAGAGAADEMRRATGVLEPRPEGTPVADATELTWAQSGDRLTTAQGLRVDDADNSLKAGDRGPTLLDDFHLREKIMHFDHERIPERAVHARGAGAHGVFEATDGLGDICAASFLQKGAVTNVFTRFSTVAGSRGSADTARDVRGFATKFYTDEGNFDLVGNNIPVFFIQDGIKFPDLIHAVKPEPDREIPQAQSAHDTFWDFVSLQPESTHMLMWVMSDRAIPRSYATMEGFGVHTFRLVASDGTTSLVKFHWKPTAGVHGLVWEESQKLVGIDPDFHRRDLNERIATGNFPQWELGVQVMPDTEDQTFEGIDLLDSTKLVPEELCPVRTVGVMTLNRNPANYFAETEQVAFHPGHLVPGIDIVDDPLLHARLFSYLDTQLTRLGGPNFSQIPINRPIAPVNDNNRDGSMQQAVHEGTVAYTPNSLAAGCPFAAGGAGSYTHVPHQVDGPKLKLRPASFDDHFSQATLFFRSMTPIEQEHIVGAFSFELAKCISPDIHARMVANLAEVDAELATKVAAHLGIEAPAGSPIEPDGVAPSLSMITGPGPLEGRKVAILVDDPTPNRVLATWRKAADPLGVEIVVVGPHLGKLDNGVVVDKTIHTTQPVEYDGVVLAADPEQAMAVFTQEAFRHHKTVAILRPAKAEAIGIESELSGVEKEPDGFFAALAMHRHWDR
ncbi:catalase [soil metagenome]